MKVRKGFRGPLWPLRVRHPYPEPHGVLSKLFMGTTRDLKPGQAKQRYRLSLPKHFRTKPYSRSSYATWSSLFILRLAVDVSQLPVKVSRQSPICKLFGRKVP
jgi:hypothetical protein